MFSARFSYSSRSFIFPVSKYSLSFCFILGPILGTLSISFIDCIEEGKAKIASSPDLYALAFICSPEFDIAMANLDKSPANISL